MGDIIDMSIKDFEGKRVDVTGSVTVVNTAVETTICTLTASGGKDLWLGGAKVTGDIGTTSISLRTFRLYLNGVVVETVKSNMINSTSIELLDVNFLTKGKKVTTGQIIKITIQNADAVNNIQSDVTGKLMLWEEDSGVSPEIT